MGAFIKLQTREHTSKNAIAYTAEKILIEFLKLLCIKYNESSSAKRVKRCVVVDRIWQLSNSPFKDTSIVYTPFHELCRLGYFRS